MAAYAVTSARISISSKSGVFHSTSFTSSFRTDFTVGSLVFYAMRRVVLYATRRTGHPRLFLRQREAEDAGSVGSTHHAGQEPLDPTAPADRNSDVLPSVYAVCRRA